jgi:hypothetical protein
MSAKRIKTAYSLPTKDEQLQLRETQNLMSSNMLQMQLSEMIDAAKYENISGKNRKAFESWLSRFRAELDSLNSEFDNCTISSKWLLKRGIDMGLENYGDVQNSLVFEKPNDIAVFGSHVLRTSIQPQCSVDVAVVMPNSCFEKR